MKQLKSKDSLLAAPEMRWLDDVRLRVAPADMYSDAVAEAKALGAFSFGTGLFVENRMWREAEFRPAVKSLVQIVSIVAAFAWSPKAEAGKDPGPTTDPFSSFVAPAESQQPPPST